MERGLLRRGAGATSSGARLDGGRLWQIHLDEVARHARFWTEGGRRPPSVSLAAQNGQFPGLGSSMRLAAPFGTSEVT